MGGGAVLRQLSVNSMALPPVLNYGSDYLKDKVARDVVAGKKNICLAISEPLAGSDVANIATTAELKGDVYVVNGTKKWSAFLNACASGVSVRRSSRRTQCAPLLSFNSHWRSQGRLFHHASAYGRA